MPLNPSCHVIGSVTASRIQKLLPKSWKQYPNLVDIHVANYLPVLGTCTTNNEFMIHILFNSLKEFARRGHLLKAFETFSLIQFYASSTTHYDIFVQSISSLLLSCAKSKLLLHGKQLHSHTIYMGFEQHPILVPRLVTFYSHFNLLVDAYFVTNNSNILHPLSWNILISSYVRNGQFKEAISTYKHMITKGITPDNFTYPSVLKACSENLDLIFGREIHDSIKSSDHRWDLFVNNSLISMYGKIGELDVACQLFNEMPKRDAVSWNAVISSYAAKGMWKEAFQIFEKMSGESDNLNIITWNTIIGGCLRTGNFNGALRLLSQLRYCGSHLDSVALIVGLSACSHIKAIKPGREIHGFAVRCYFDGFDNLRNALITMYSRCNDLRHAYMLFRLVKSKTVVTWNSILSGYSHRDRYEDASFLFREMLLSGIEPNYVTIAAILPLCARMANLQHGKEFHCYIINMYARSGRILEAKRVFDSMNERDEVTYTSLIAAYGLQGDGQSALKLFYDMNRHQIKPDYVTMVAVLSACSHSGLLNEGQMLFNKMYSDYGIVPSLEHFACMVDLFGRAGLLYKAKEVIAKMPFKPTSSLWATFLGACRIYGNTDMGEWAADKLLEMRPENSGYYVLIANLYAAAGCWDKLAEVRTFMRNLGVRKDPGCAWVDVGSGFSPFLVADTSQPQAKKLYALLESLTEIMKDDGDVDREILVLDYQQLQEGRTFSNSLHI
ncbi:hypothetical protein K2173_003829 [Erythroxylum novogranatense]|uniref:Pentatricopeptide repeat-containing protein n=1 Tax=Erythroxylum novogranatense TaxID=1862640 RepID=A0AAV8SJR2_9ROSI|nr:hypothetical protein K2173_003829 [Erythroxylum novogranatense]